MHLSEVHEEEDAEFGITFGVIGLSPPAPHPPLAVLDPHAARPDVQFLRFHLVQGETT